MDRRRIRALIAGLFALIAVVVPTPLIAAAAKPSSTAPKTTAADEKLTAENYEKIKTGMTSDQVKEILGPSRSGGHDSSGNAFADWSLKNDRKHKITVNFKDGVVVSKSNSIDFAAIAAKDTAAKEVAAKEATKAAQATAIASLASNFAKLKPGMTEAQVQEILGAGGKSEKASAGRSALIWEYLDGRFAYVIFQDGKATAMDCSEVPPADHKLTPALFHRIRVGMELADVRKIMGSDGEASQARKDAKYTWRENRDSVGVVMHDGKVSEVLGTLKDKPLVSFEKTGEDKLGDALATLGSTSADKKSIQKALELLGRTPVDPAKAPQVSKLIERHLADKDTFVAMAAKGCFKRWATKENVPYLLGIISKPLTKSPNDKNREEIPLAIEILGDLKEPQAVPHLVRLLRDFFSTSEASLALKKIGPAAAEPELRKLASQHKDAVRDRAEQILAEFKDGGPFLAGTIKRLKDPSQDQRGVAADELSKMYVHPAHKAEVVRALLPVVADTSWVAATHACNAMARWGGPESEQALIAALANPQAEVKIAAATALKNWGTAKSIAALEPLTKDPNGEVAIAAGDAIAVIKAR